VLPFLSSWWLFAKKKKKQRLVSQLRLKNHAEEFQSASKSHPASSVKPISRSKVALESEKIAVLTPISNVRPSNEPN
jgi:hypothetical protein